MNISHPIILCGFTSSGKTTIGRLLAASLDIPFYDTDELLIRQNQMTIPEIFAKGGESLFRDLEHEIAAKVCTLGPSVISTGGGMLTYERNAALLAAHGVIIYINRPFDQCCRNLSAQPDRPLFHDHTREELMELYISREEKYTKYAALSVRNDGAPEDTVRQILEKLGTAGA